jgi:hypothetical protein
MTVDARGGALVAARVNGAAAKKHGSLAGVGTVSVDPADQVGAGFFNHDVTITGVAVGDIVHVQPPETLENDLRMVGAAAQAANTVRIRMQAIAAVNGAARDWSYIWIDLT